ncbi:MAG: Gfo/Idh/MocA family oxidoreductase [Lentisphaerae bacterium]|nr:Gfo/Idh/MocA family oxidoreductase [Lentisphaerota bacterium]
MTEKLKIGCIGAGSSGVGHLMLLERYEPGSCVAFCDLNRNLFDEIVGGYFANNPASAAGDFKTDSTGLRASFKDLPFYTDPEEMFKKEDINTVVIASYCSSHAEMVERCVKHKVNILLEKPIAIKADEIERVWQLLKNYPKVSTVNFTMRGAPVSLAAKKHVQDGDIGKLVSVQYVNNVHYGDNYFRNWMRTQAKVGDLFLQKATHDFDMINSIAGLRPVSIAAFGSRLVYGGDKPNDLTCDNCEEKWTCLKSIYRKQLDSAKPLPPKHVRKCVFAREIDIDDNQVVIIQYEGGVTASYSQTFNAPQQGGQRGGQFIGTDGIMELKYYGQFSETPQGQMIVGNSQIHITRWNAKAGSNIHETYDWGGHNHFDGTEYVIWGKLDMLHGRHTEIKNTIEEGYISAKMCLAAQESIKTGRIVKLDLQGI